MKPFPVKSDKLDVRGFDNRQVVKIAQDFFKALMHKTKRQLYIRSAYFGKKKIFFTYFWKHLYQKSPRQRRIRIVYLPCAIELIQKCRNAPDSMINTSKEIEMFHRFTGITKEKELFYVQIKENIKTDRKEFMSVFPAKG
ncbi:hypothetical protein A2715_02435 [Candidatus Woesebacteria bacterium RIFCSPHIGHO2_01_FULL_39_32]|nr:MAG: hypothetical protein A2715_02435 [Candidatus Woesebacteria bacterium RIFCSPHIGHO2_01_FULL_39_32]